MTSYWNEQFTTRATPHSDQNKEISKDFFLHITSKFSKELLKSKEVIEIGCGTGEFSRLISDKYNSNVLGTDISVSGIEYANTNYKNTNTKFEVLDVISTEFKTYDLALCSNILEHFRNPFVVIDKVLKNCKSFIILVPYDQPNTDGYEYEGGPGHVFRFTEESFKNYNVLDSFKFRTNGWQHSACGETPYQFAVLLKGLI